MYIACPRCDWKPTSDSVWVCSCEYRWNTFETHGVCPQCNRTWEMTQCLVCHQWSDHEDWYHDDDALTLEAYLANPTGIAHPMTDHLEVGASAPTPPANIDVVGELFDELQVVFKQLMEMDEQDVVDAQRLKMARQAPTDGNTTLIVPIGQVPSLALDTAIDTLLATFNHSVQIEPRIPIPGEAFNQRRKQYRAVHILERLEHCILPDTFRVIGLIDEDIYGPGTNQVLGLHLPGSRAIVLGVHRLMFPSPQEYKPAEAHQRIASLLVSQVSGSLGLPVCKNRACARSVPTTLVDSEQRSAQLCPDCAAQLKGWLR